MKRMVVASCVAILPCTSTTPTDSGASLLVLEPTLEQRANARAVLTVAFDSSLNDILTTRCTGIFSDDELAQCVDKCRDRCSTILSFFRETL
jgi:ribonuclease PH